MKIKYTGKQIDLPDNKKQLIQAVCDSVSEIISLPNAVEIIVRTVDKSIHGFLDVNAINKIHISNELLLQDIPIVLVHELIHLHQKHVGDLQGAGHHAIFWKNKAYTKPNYKNMSLREYNSYPWEADVAKKQQEILDQISAQIAKFIG